MSSAQPAGPVRRPRPGLELPDHLPQELTYLNFPPGRRNLRPADSQAAWHAGRAAAGPDDLKFHRLRHTRAALAAQSGATLADLMGRLGHTTPAMAMIYQHTAAQRDRLIADRLSQIALGNQSPLGVNASRSAAKPRRARSTDSSQPTLLDA